MKHYLDQEIKDLTEQCEVVKEIDGVLYRGHWGASRVVGKRVYFFEVGVASAEEFFDLRSNREARLAGLEWVIKGRV